MTFGNNAKMIGLAGAIGLAIFTASMVPAFAQYIGDDQTVTTNSKVRTVQIQLTGSAHGNATAPITFELVTGPSFGVIDSFDEATGLVVYTANKHYVGQDSFTFTTHDATNNAFCCDNTGTVTVDVQPGKGGAAKRIIANLAAQAILELETIPESTSGLSLYEATIGPPGFNLMSAMRATTAAGMDWNSLTEGQQVWLMENFNALLAGSMEVIETTD